MSPTSMGTDIAPLFSIYFSCLHQFWNVLLLKQMLSFYVCHIAQHLVFFWCSCYAYFVLTQHSILVLKPNGVQMFCCTLMYHPCSMMVRFKSQQMVKRGYIMVEARYIITQGPNPKLAICPFMWSTAVYVQFKIGPQYTIIFNIDILYLPFN